MMKAPFEAPELEVILFRSGDVVDTSVSLGEEDLGDNNWPA